MSLVVGGALSSRNMGFDEAKGTSKEESEVSERPATKSFEECDGMPGRQVSEVSRYATEEEEEEEDEDENGNGRKDFDLGPQLSLKEQLEKDKEDESLRRWKEQLLGSVDLENAGETLEPEVKILSISIVSPGRTDLLLPIPEVSNPKSLWFTLKEGSCYKLKLSFQVSHNIVSGLKYTNTVWKTGIKVDSTKEMLGTFSPQLEPYIHELPEEITPSGIFAKGSYSARTKFIDDDKKCYLEINYTFDIRKDWPSIN